MSTSSASTDFADQDLALGAIETALAPDVDDLEQDVQDAIDAVALDGEITTGEALELQYTLAKWALLYEAVSNMGKKIDDAIANTIANMR